MRLLETWRGTLPDVIFLDLNMPLKNGFESLDEIEAEQRLQQLRVVILSTSSQREMVQLLQKKRASMYIQKPGTYPELKFALEKSLSIDLPQLAATDLSNKFIVIP
jgi:CheY-like chemotaxis protein